MVFYLRALILAAVLPVAFFLYFIYRQDKLDKESPRMLWRLFTGGVLCSVAASVLEYLYEIFIGTAQTVQGVFLEMFLGVGLVEEDCKLFMLRRRSWNSPEFNCRFDGIVYAVFVSLGFACIENILYVFRYGLGSAVTRALLSIPGHTVFGVFMGAFYSDAKLAQVSGRDPRARMTLALLVPMGLHGFYDFCLTVGSKTMTEIFFLYALVLDVAAFVTVRRRSLTDRFL